MRYRGNVSFRADDHEPIAQLQSDVIAGPDDQLAVRSLEAEHANARLKGTVFCGAVEDAPIPADTFDVVTIWDVIEHLPDPASDLRAISER